MSFGLGPADEAHLYRADGTTQVDSTSWSVDGNPTWGRCPDGTGPFGNTSASTKGTANTCPATGAP
ncbi:MAG TPA: hypothetical protein VN903_05090 [Polyangia bacterium]|nr:hypothetical protein [Polyangia bacterium]